MRTTATHAGVELPDGFDALEEFLRTSRENKDSQTLLLPSPGCDAAVGFKISQLQALLTWAQISSPSTIVLRDDAFKNGTVLTPLEIAGVRISSNALARSSATDGRASAVANAIDSTKALSRSLESSEPLPEYWLIIPDYTSQAFPRLLYTPSDQVKLAEAFYFLITKAVSLNLRHLEISQASLTDIVRKSLATVFYELFKNTHDWARTSWNGERVQRSIRAIHLRVFPPGEFLLDGQPKQLSEYLHRTKRSNLPFVEVSILDSGPGFAQRFAKRPVEEIPSLDEEYGLIQRCMNVHGSSSEDPRKGLGLHGVIEALDSVRGFFRLRTGRLSLCRALDTHRYAESKSGLIGAARYNPWLMDAGTGKLRWTEMPFVSGTLLTAVLPLQR